MRNLIDQIIKSILPRSGLILGFIGTLMMAFSFGKSIVGTEEENDNGRIVPTASFTHLGSAIRWKKMINFEHLVEDFKKVARKRLDYSSSHDWCGLVPLLRQY